jgi:putative addiction module killer protein
MQLLKTEVFDKWLKKLKDKRAKAIIQVHLNRLIEEQFGKVKAIGESVYEKKINYGPGYRIYFIHHKQNLIILLCGGDKSTQQSDINQAKNLAEKAKKELKG